VSDEVARIALRLRNRRLALGYSQHVLAQKVGTSQSAISDWESGGVAGIQVNSLERWGAALGLQVQVVVEDIWEESA